MNPYKWLIIEPDGSAMAVYIDEPWIWAFLAMGMMSGITEMEVEYVAD